MSNHLPTEEQKDRIKLSMQAGMKFAGDFKEQRRWRAQDGREYCLVAMPRDWYTALMLYVSLNGIDLDETLARYREVRQDPGPTP